MTLASLPAGAAPAAASELPAQVPGQIIVRFEPAAEAADRAAARVEAEVDFEQALPLRGVQLVEADPGQSVAAAQAQLERSPDVAYAEPNFIRQAQAVPNDPFFGSLYGFHNTGQAVLGSPGTPDADIDAPEAWNLTTGSPSLVVGVVDSGVDVSHPDLSPSIWTNPGESGGGRESNGIDDDANGLVDDWRGWDWVTDDNLPGDENGHGTHVSGTIAARGNNAGGVTGVSWNSRVMPLRVLGADGSGSVADLVSAYRYAAAKGARIVNASLGGSGFSRAELDAIEAAPDILFVVAAGNAGGDVDTAPDFPCSYQAANVVCVAASDQNDGLASFSNFGLASVDLAAPGVSILSTVPGGGYAFFSGTSMASPHAAGVAALIWSLEPGAGVAGVKSALLGGTDAKPAFAARTVTGGRLNAERSLRLAAASGGLPLAVSLPAVPTSGASDPAPDRSAPPGEADAPVLSLALASRRRLRTALSRGLVLRARCSERCALQLRMFVDGPTARRAGLSRSGRPVVLGRTAVVATPRAGTIRIRFGRRARIRLRGARSVRLTVRAIARDGAGDVARHSLRILLRR